ncbi:MAG TPA: tRNA (guanosine(46)-N7)-methyltransferase TrmB [Bacteroidales bacterium]|nr:tRNA (guanosine(46)-N7)-methyltransferase TrmB [Bacteroidales bacterium]HSA43428.1 tRNA (guanosine(46)-N7)-methyltransferase TrmB [Bacteroidales bacterium]
MTKNKLERFAENREFRNMFQPRWEDLQQGFAFKGRWRDFFGNDHPIVLEVGCGKGEYTVNQAIRNPGKNYIGVDIKGARMWRGCKTSNDLGLTNVAFIRTHVQLLHHFLQRAEVSEIWITFPDPQPRQSREKRRLTAPRFLSLYGYLLKEGGLIHLKTDNRDLYDYSLEVIREHRHLPVFATHDLYSEAAAPEPAISIQTFYEKMFLEEGKPICYLAFRLAEGRSYAPITDERP